MFTPKPVFPKASMCFFIWFYFLGLAPTAADVGAKMKSEGRWYSGINCSSLHQRKETDCSQDKSSVYNVKCAIAHSIDLNDLVTQFRPRQLFPTQDLCHVLSKSSPNLGYRYMFPGCFSQFRPLNCLVVKSRKAIFPFSSLNLITINDNREWFTFFQSCKCFFFLKMHMQIYLKVSEMMKLLISTNI